MKRILFLSIAVMTLLACNNKQRTSGAKGEPGSIFLTEYDTPFGMPPFDQIEFDDFKPAFLEGIDQEDKEIEAIATNTEAPTFENTIVALDNSGTILSRVSRVFYGLRSAETNDDIQALAQELSPILSEHSDNIYLNEQLFNRIKTLHDDTTGMQLTTEQYRLLDRYYKRFVRSEACWTRTKRTTTK